MPRNGCRDERHVAGQRARGRRAPRPGPRRGRRGDRRPAAIVVHPEVPGGQACRHARSPTTQPDRRSDTASSSSLAVEDRPPSPMTARSCRVRRSGSHVRPRGWPRSGIAAIFIHSGAYCGKRASVASCRQPSSEHRRYPAEPAGLLRELAERRGPARRDDRLWRRSTRSSASSRAGRGGHLPDHQPCRRVRGRVDGGVDAADAAGGDSGVARMAASRADARADCPALVRNSYQGSRAISKVRGGTARIDVRAPFSAPCASRWIIRLCGFLRRGVHPPAHAVQPAGAGRGPRLPRHGQAGVRDERLLRQRARRLRPPMRG